MILRVVELRLALASNLREQQALRAGQSAPGRGQKRKRETPADPGPSSGAPGVAQQLAELQRQREALLDQLAELRVGQLPDSGLKDSGWMHGTKKELDPARLEELRSEIARGGLCEQCLAEIERELAGSEPITQEFLRAIWRAIAKADRRQR